MTFNGQEIAKRRRAKRLTQKELAAEVGISRQYLSMLECGRATNPSVALAQSLYQALAFETLDQPERRFVASCYLCGSTDGLQMVPHRKDGTRETPGRLVGWIFSCDDCAPKLYGTELVALTPDQQLMYERLD